MKAKLMANLSKFTGPAAKVFRKGLRLTKANSNFLLTLLAVLGFAVTAEELVRATIKAVKLCEEKGVKDGKDVIKTVWKIYIPAAGFFLVTTIAVVSNAKINAKRLATVTSLCALNSAEAKAWKEKAKELIGPKKAEKMEESIVKDQMDKEDIPPDDQIIRTGHGEELMKEYLTGQWIYDSPAHVELVQEKLNNRLESEPDGIVAVSWYLEQFSIDPDCYIAEAIWDLADMCKYGDTKIGLNLIYNGRKRVGNVDKMTSCIKPSILPTGI